MFEINIFSKRLSFAKKNLRTIHPITFPLTIFCFFFQNQSDVSVTSRPKCEVLVWFFVFVFA